MIHVCSLAKLHDTVARTGAGSVVTLINASTPVARPDSIAADRHLFLGMNDIVEAAPDMTLPGAEHIERLIAFARAWDRAKPKVIHCYAGISRSTAAAYIVASTLAPERDAVELAQTLRKASPTATPNARLIALADDMLDRKGRMVDAIRAIGRGAEAYEGVPFELPLSASVRTT
jgi:predicted protein tyrosine phosphatase